MATLQDYKPAITMVGMQFIYAGVSLFTRVALVEGMSPRVFVVYRQAIGTSFISPIAFFTRRKNSACSLGWKSFYLIFMTSLIGVTINQNIYFEGLYLASSSIAGAMGNLVPAVTFVMATIFGMEKLKMGSLRSTAKILGTIMCVSGAVAMALLRGPKLLNSEFLLVKSVFGSRGENWLLGCLFLFASCCCWSLWLILQVPVTASYPDHLSLTAWMCLMATIQSAIVTLIMEPDFEAWKLTSYLQFGVALFSGVGSAVSFFGQAWCIAQTGPLFSAMFNPLCTVIITIFASIFLQEEIYTGSLVGSIGVIIGLYVVLWGKAKDIPEINEDISIKPQSVQQANTVVVLTDENLDKPSCKTDLEEPLLLDKTEV